MCSTINNIAKQHPELDVLHNNQHSELDVLHIRQR